MFKYSKAELYIALRCIDRLAEDLHARDLPMPDEIHAFINDVWALLKGNKARLALTKTDRHIGRLIVDEQDAGFEESLTNRLYYALSNLILFLQDGNTAAAEGVREETLEFFRYIAAHDYMLALGGGAFIFDDADEARIEADARVANEKEQQANDDAVVGAAADWSTMERGMGQASGLQ